MSVTNTSNHLSSANAGDNIGISSVGNVSENNKSFTSINNEARDTSSAQNLSHSEKINQRKVSSSLGEKIKNAFKQIFNKIKTIFGGNKNISDYLEKINDLVSKLNAANQTIETANKIIQHLNRAQNIIKNESKNNPNLAQEQKIEESLTDIEELKKQIEELKKENQGLQKQVEHQGQQKIEEKTNILESIQNDSSESFISNDIISILNKEQPKEIINNIHNEGIPTPPDGAVPPAPPPPLGAVPPPAPILGNIKDKTNVDTKQNPQEAFNKLVKYVFDFVKNGQNIFIEGLSKEPVVVKTLSGFKNAKNTLVEALDSRKAKNEKMLDEIDKNIDTLKEICDQWIEQLPKNLTLAERDLLIENYASNPIKFFSDANKLRNLKLLNDNIFNELNGIKSYFSEEKIESLSKTIKEYNEQTIKNQNLAKELNKLKPNISDDKKAEYIA